MSKNNRSIYQMVDVQKDFMQYNERVEGSTLLS